MALLTEDKSVRLSVCVKRFWCCKFAVDNLKWTCADNVCVALFIATSNRKENKGGELENEWCRLQQSRHSVTEMQLNVLHFKF